MAKLIAFGSQRDKKKLFYGGYGYVFHKSTVNMGWRWVCEHKNSKKCTAYAYTKENVKDDDSVNEFGLHNHDPNPSKVDVTETK